jgi:hypothetical protein
MYIERGSNIQIHRNARVCENRFSLAIIHTILHVL